MTALPDSQAALAVLHRVTRPLFVSLLLGASLVTPPLIAMPNPASASDILQQLRCFGEMGSVLYIAAHPDDENTRLIAYLARSRGYRTAYLSLTRGDGGQNLIGPEQGSELGVIRTEELLAARQIDGGRQFFTRAIDFGFSKDYRETFQIWDRDAVLSDVVRVIREFRPDVIVTRFSTEPGGTHGHHTASAILALEAFKLAGDSNAYPDQLKSLSPWQPKRIFWNAWVPPGRGGDTDSGVLRLDVGDYLPLLGTSIGEIAARSRSMHQSQGMGNVASRGPATESFRLLAGDPAQNDIMDGVDATWNRVPGGAEIGKLADEVVKEFNPLDPAASVPLLLQIRSRLNALNADGLEFKRRQLDQILQGCLGLYVETTLPVAEVVPGETLRLRHTVIDQSGYPVRWLGVRYPATGREVLEPVELKTNQPASREVSEVLPARTPLTQPYWLREDPSVGMYRVDDPSLIGLPVNPPAFPVEQIFEIGGQRLAIPDAPVQVSRDPVRGEMRDPLEVIPPVTLEFPEDLELFAPGATRQVRVRVRAVRGGIQGTVRLNVPEGWKSSPDSLPLSLAHEGDSTQMEYAVTAPSHAASVQLLAVATVGGLDYSTRRVEIRHESIPPILLQPPARLKAVSVDLQIRGRRVGYVPGAGDTVAECLQRMGYEVEFLSGADLTADRLRGLDAVVLGVRALNTREDLGPRIPALQAFAENGGNVIVQYTTPQQLQVQSFAPYPLTLSRDRVTDETAEVTLLAPEHPALTTPNRIGPQDFEGWIQERGLYFASAWDPHFIPLLACHDAGEPALQGGLLVAPCGKGYFIYTGFSWFRELPAGVPGAYRLFANLVSLGKPADAAPREGEVK